MGGVVWVGWLGGGFGLGRVWMCPQGVGCSGQCRHSQSSELLASLLVALSTAGDNSCTYRWMSRLWDR